MAIDRRTFLRTAGTVPALAALSATHAGRALAQHKTFQPQPGTWRTYEITTRVEIAKPAGVSRVWIPVPSVDDTYQRTLETQWSSSGSGNAGTIQTFRDGKYGATGVYAEFAETTAAPVVEVVSRIRAQDRAQDWSRRTPTAEDAGTLKFWTAATDLMPTDGIVRDTAMGIVRGKRTELDRVRALYEWTIDNTFRDVNVRGCGVGDIKAMLETNSMGGKCGDINALFVGLNRAIGIPARDVYGIRVGPSAFGYKSLGAGNANVTRAQHCRAEVFLRDYGWVAMDPADVGKAMREETGDWIKTTSHPLIAPLKPALFGGWEGNWLAYNVAHDVAMPGAKGPRVGFFMYPVAETATGRLDSLDPDTFKYTITTRQITG